MVSFVRMLLALCVVTSMHPIRASEVCYPMLGNSSPYKTPFRFSGMLSYLRINSSANSPFDAFQTVSNRGSCVEVYINYNVRRLTIIVSCWQHKLEFIDLQPTSTKTIGKGDRSETQWRMISNTIKYSHHFKSFMMHMDLMDLNNRNCSIVLAVGHTDYELRRFDPHYEIEASWRHDWQCNCPYRLRFDRVCLGGSVAGPLHVVRLVLGCILLLTII